MPGPATYGGLGVRGGGLGLMGLGGPQQPQPFAFSPMPALALPYIAHLYTNTMQFKRTLGDAASVGGSAGSALITKPGLKMTLNGGYQPITLDLAGPPTGVIALGDIIRLTENGDNSGAILYTGIVEELPDEVGTGGGGSRHQVTLTPLVAELGDTAFNFQYATLVDVAQMVRDAVAKTAHCRVSQMSCGDTGVQAIYYFNQTNALEVLNIAKKIAGVNFWWFVDATGLVWFQSTTPTNPARITLKRGSDFTRRKSTPSIVGLKNLINALGGFVDGAAKPIQSTYTNPTSQASYGVRSLDPPLILPTVTDQATLDKITATLGAAFDRIQTTVELDAPALAQRLTLAVPGGLTTRLWEPGQEAIAQPSSLGSGGYTGPYVAQDIEVNGIVQKVITGDVPVAGMADMQHELDRIVQRTGTLSRAKI